MTNSPIDKNFQSELDFSKAILDNISQRKSDPVGEAAPKISSKEISEMRKFGEAAAEITGFEELNPRSKTESTSLIESSLSAIDCNPLISTSLAEKVMTVIDRMESYEKFLKKFLAKYG